MASYRKRLTKEQRTFLEMVRREHDGMGYTITIHDVCEQGYYNEMEQYRLQRVRERYMEKMKQKREDDRSGMTQHLNDPWR
jgi:hypothetical protein